LKGKTKRQAISHLRSIGLDVGVNFTYINDLGKNVVRGLRYKGKTINQGDKLPLKSIINLVLGNGKRR